MALIQHKLPNTNTVIPQKVDLSVYSNTQSTDGASAASNVKQMYDWISSDSLYNYKYTVGEDSISYTKFLIRNNTSNASLQIDFNLPPYLVVSLTVTSSGQLPSGLIADLPPTSLQSTSITLAAGVIQEFSIGIDHAGAEMFVQSRQTISNVPIQFTVTPIEYTDTIKIIPGLLPLTFGSTVISPPTVVNSVTGKSLTLELVPINSTVKILEDKLYTVDARYGSQSDLQSGLGTKLIFPPNSITWASTKSTNTTLLRKSIADALILTKNISHSILSGATVPYVYIQNNNLAAIVTGIIPGKAVISAALTAAPVNITSDEWTTLLKNRIDSTQNIVTVNADLISISTPVTVLSTLNLPMV